MMNSAMKYGLYIGLILCGLGLLAYIAGLDFQNKAMNWVSYIVMIGGLYFAIKGFRDNENGGFIKYGRALGFGTLTSLFFGAVQAIYLYLFLTVISPESLEQIMDTTYEQYLNSGMSETEADQAMRIASPFMKPPMMAVYAILGSVVMGLIFSLVISIFLKRDNPNPFPTEES